MIDFIKYDEISYSIISFKERTAQTGYNESNPAIPCNYDKENVVIQSHILYQNKYFQVTTIAEYSFTNNSNILSITIPATVKYINKHAFY